MGYIYVLENKINSKCYVGQTIKKFNRRFDTHLFNMKNKKYAIGCALNKYGVDNFNKHKYIIPNNMLDYFEIELIKRLNTVAPGGYNLTSGGNKYKEVSDETRNKISKANKGKITGKKHHMYGKKMPKETREKVSKSKKGQIPWNKGIKTGIKPWLGKKRKPETIRKIAESKKGKIPWNKGIKMKPISQEHKLKISNAQKGRKHTDEHNRKVSEAQKGKIIPIETRLKISKTLKGIKQTEERKKKQSKIMKAWWKNRKEG